MKTNALRLFASLVDVVLKVGTYPTFQLKICSFAFYCSDFKQLLFVKSSPSPNPAFVFQFGDINLPLPAHYSKGYIANPSTHAANVPFG